MPINEPLIGEITGIINLVEGNSLLGLKAAQQSIPKMINAHTRRLNQLRATETLLLQKVRRELTLLQLEGQRSDKYMKVAPMQSLLASQSGDPDPHEYIVYDLNKIKLLPLGIQELLSTQKAMASEIRQLIAQIRDLNTELQHVNDAIAAKAGTDVAMAKDKVAEQAVGQLFNLWEIYAVYKSYSRDANGSVAYSSDNQIVSLLEKLQTRFRAFAEQNPYVLDGQLVLNLNDPGSDANGSALSTLIDKIRKTANSGTSSVALEAKVKKYRDSLTKNLNDAFISQNIQRRTESKNTPGPGDSMAQMTKNSANVLQFTNGAAQWWTQFLSGQDLLKAQTLAFRRRVKASYAGLPFCDEKPSTKSTEDKSRDQAIAEQNAIALQATQNQQKDLQKQGLTPTTDPQYSPWASA